MYCRQSFRHMARKVFNRTTMESTSQLRQDQEETPLTAENHITDGPEEGPRIPQVVIESTGQSRFANSVVKVLSLQRFYKKTRQRSRDSWLERYTYQDERDWRRPLMRRSGSSSPQAQSPSSEGTASSRDTSDAWLDDHKDGRCSCDVTLVFDPSGNVYFFWLLTVVLAILYNYWIIIFRVAFFVREQKYVIPFMVIDYTCDFIFLLDIIVQFRTGYFLDGKIVTSTKQLAKSYITSRGFFLDCVSIFPTDLLYLVVGPRPFLRFGRLLKAHRFFLFCDRVEIYSGRPKLFNLLKLIHYLFLIIHWVACLYFLLSYFEGFGADKWVHPRLEGQWAEIGPQYLFSLFRSLLSMTTVGTGKTVAPKSTMSLTFCIFTYLCGVLIFATIVGNAADMIVDLRRHREKYHKKLDGMKEYIAANQLPMDLQRRVIQWFDFAWRYKKDMSEEKLFEHLNDNFRAEIAIHVNLDTLKKVKMFEHCDPGFLRELVLKLKPMLCSPGDQVCRQDEIGREMYIVNKGELEVMDKSGAVLAKLSAGRHFGEISILDMKGIGNRRTASVRSVGFSDLFRLSKKDLEEVIEYYPEEQDKLAKIARQTYENQRRERLNQKIKVEERDDSSLEKNDPRRWLTADKETLQRRLSLIEAKNDVRCLANKFRREHGHEINPRDIVATLAQRARMERSDEESRLIVKEFLAQKTRNRIPKESTVSHDSIMAQCDERLRNNYTKELITPFLENRSLDHLRKSQRKFFGRPRSRTQDSSPSSPTSSEIPLFTFKSHYSGNIDATASRDKDKHAEAHGGAFTIKLNSIPVHTVKAPVFKKGILKKSSSEIMKWRPYDSAENSSCNESAESDTEDHILNHTGHKIKFKDKLKAHFTKEKRKQETRIILATPENSEIVEDSPRFQRAADRIIPTDHNPINEINKELHSIAHEKRCTCQLEDTQVQKTVTSTLTAETPIEKTAFLEADWRKGACSLEMKDENTFSTGESVGGNQSDSEKENSSING
ncbi:cyclic nucleotide-gated channel alpha-3-like isoform X2 [Montipora capricornis]|uniref:cyclic nucleotide-gated channel alpha-3-like isoform X2 n=1 Tax=Montipora capricornis TaxID=246305 RepID=UPI0035F177D4